MSSMTIHALDMSLDQRLTEEARRSKTSKNQLVKDLLARSLGMPASGIYADDYREFCGVWSKSEQQVFDTGQEENSQVDKGDWRP